MNDDEFDRVLKPLVNLFSEHADNSFEFKHLIHMIDSFIDVVYNFFQPRFTQTALYRDFLKHLFEYM